jgi:hypothetical protein
LLTVRSFRTSHVANGLEEFVGLHGVEQIVQAATQVTSDQIVQAVTQVTSDQIVQAVTQVTSDQIVQAVTQVDKV